MFRGLGSLCIQGLCIAADSKNKNKHTKTQKQKNSVRPARAHQRRPNTHTHTHTHTHSGPSSTSHAHPMEAWMDPAAAQSLLQHLTRSDFSKPSKAVRIGTLLLSGGPPLHLCFEATNPHFRRPLDSTYAGTVKSSHVSQSSSAPWPQEDATSPTPALQ